jgi:predicted alpha/beta superfamily hydrolase
VEWQDYPLDDGKLHSVVGTLKVCRGFTSPQLENARDILVYLPPSYATSPERRYPVIYMQDGQNLFDVATSFAGEWEVDQTLEQTAREDGLEAIVVGIPNMGKARLDEYTPFKDQKLGGGLGRRYVSFIAHTLKPCIDADFRTLTGRESTGIAGSSLGGLVSLYGFFRYPRVFGFVGCMSPALWLSERRIFQFVEAMPHRPGRIYIDCGTAEGEAETLDVERLCSILRSKGYEVGKDLVCVIEPGAAHEEKAWARRFRGELKFLLRGEVEAAVASASEHPPATPAPHR